MHRRAAVLATVVALGAVPALAGCGDSTTSGQETPKSSLGSDDGRGAPETTPTGTTETPATDD